MFTAAWCQGQPLQDASLVYCCGPAQDTFGIRILNHTYEMFLILWGSSAESLRSS